MQNRNKVSQYDEAQGWLPSWQEQERKRKQTKEQLLCDKFVMCLHVQQAARSANSVTSACDSTTNGTLYVHYGKVHMVLYLIHMVPYLVHKVLYLVHTVLCLVCMVPGMEYILFLLQACHVFACDRHRL